LSYLPYIRPKPYPSTLFTKDRKALNQRVLGTAQDKLLVPKQNAGRTFKKRRESALRLFIILLREEEAGVE
jgi:hypothetical protein